MRDLHLTETRKWKGTNGANTTAVFVVDETATGLDLSPPRSLVVKAEEVERRPEKTALGRGLLKVRGISFNAVVRIEYDLEDEELLIQFIFIEHMS